MDKFFKEKKKEGRTARKQASLPWIQKYRPSSLDSMASQEQVVDALRGVVQSKQLPQLLFYGPAGTGKTSAILALARELFGEHVRERILELNASNQRGISVVRDKIKNFSKTMVGKVAGLPTLKLIILDQADSMTNDAQSALRRIIEDFSETTRFCIICNYISKIIEPIGSRCIKYRFKPISPETQVERLAFICEQQMVSHQSGALARLVQISAGDLRKGVNLLQLCASTFANHITSEHVQSISGVVGDSMIAEILSSVRKSASPAQVIAMAREIERQGLAADNLLMGLLHVTMRSDIEEAKKAGLVMHITQTERNLNEGGDCFLQVQAMIMRMWGHLHLT